MTENKQRFRKDEPRRGNEGDGRVTCPICGAVVDLADVAEVSRHLNGLHSKPFDKAASF